MASTKEETTGAGWTLPVVICGLVALGPVSTDLYLPSLPTLATVFATDEAAVQRTLSVFLIGFAVSQLLYGPLSDRFGRRPVLMGGVAIYVFASIGCALANSVESLTVWRFFQALGACCGPVVGRAVIRDVYGREQAARILAYVGMAMALAPAIGPIVGGILTEAFGWRSNFWVLTGFGIGTLAAVVLLLAETNRVPDPDALRPAQQLRNYGVMLRHRQYLGYVCVVAGVYSAIFSFISGSSFVIVDGLGLSPTAYGFCFAAVVAGYMVGSFSAGRLTGRFGSDRMILAGAGIATAAGLGMLVFALAGWFTVISVVTPFVAAMIGIGLVLPNAVAGAVGPFPRMAGLAAAFLGFAQFGVAALVGLVVGALTDRTALPMAATIFVVCLGSLLAHLLLVRSPGAEPQEGMTT